MNFVVLFSDLFTSFVDICSSKTKVDDKPVHLWYRNNINSAVKYKTCSCHIEGEGGNFSVAASDIRLMSVKGRTCSPVQIYVNDQTFTCDKTKEDYGSVFLQTVNTNVAQYLLKMYTGNFTMEPKMIHFVISPERRGMSLFLNL